MQPACKSLFLRVGTVRFKVEDPESLSDGIFHAGRETALPADIRCGSIQVRDIARFVEQAFKGICRELLAEPRAVIDLPVPVVDESCAVNASFIIFTEYHIYSLPVEQTDEILPVAPAAVHGECDTVPYRSVFR